MKAKEGLYICMIVMFLLMDKFDACVMLCTFGRALPNQSIRQPFVYALVKFFVSVFDIIL